MIPYRTAGAPSFSPRGSRKLMLWVIFYHFFHVSAIAER
jgi:hypothetical protein